MGARTGREGGWTHGGTAGGRAALRSWRDWVSFRAGWGPQSRGLPLRGVLTRLLLGTRHEPRPGAPGPACPPGSQLRPWRSRVSRGRRDAGHGRSTLAASRFLCVARAGHRGRAVCPRAPAGVSGAGRGPFRGARPRLALSLAANTAAHQPARRGGPALGCPRAPPGRRARAHGVTARGGVVAPLTAVTRLLCLCRPAGPRGCPEVLGRPVGMSEGPAGPTSAAPPRTASGSGPGPWTGRWAGPSAGRGGAESSSRGQRASRVRVTDGSGGGRGLPRTHQRLLRGIRPGGRPPCS